MGLSQTQFQGSGPEHFAECRACAARAVLWNVHAPPMRTADAQVPGDELFVHHVCISSLSQVACHGLSHPPGWKCLDYRLCNMPAAVCGLHHPCASMLQPPEMVSVPLEELVLQNQLLLSRRYIGREGN